MRIVQINTFPHKATGSIMMNIHQLLKNNGHQSYVVWGRGRKANNEDEFSITDDVGVKLHGIYTRIFDRTGFASISATKKLLTYLDVIKPEIIHIHNLHGYYLNIRMLSEYIRKKQIKVVWTFHDCWPFTGHCAYFELVGCEKWKKGCHHCEQLKTYPISYLCDNSLKNWKDKRKLFSELEITVIVPSNWLWNLVKQSFFKDYPIKVIHNGINLDVFNYQETDTAIKNKYGLGEKKIILGVASEWTERKGLNDFIQLATYVGDEFQIILVGLTKKQIDKLPEGVAGFERTSNVHELVQLYSAADIFFNPTYEDNFPTTNIEALACGTPVVTYDTGGSPEALIEGINQYGLRVGAIIQKETTCKVNMLKVAGTIKEVSRVQKQHFCDKSNSLNEKMVCRNIAKNFSMNLKLSEYIALYQSIAENSLKEI